MGVERATIALTSLHREYGEDGVPVLVKDGDETGKSISQSATNFVLEHGVSILGVRIPWGSDYSFERRRYENKGIYPFGDMQDEQKWTEDVKISADLLGNAVKQTIESSLGRYKIREEAHGS